MAGKTLLLAFWRQPLISYRQSYRHRGATHLPMELLLEPAHLSRVRAAGTAHAPNWVRHFHPRT